MKRLFYQKDKSVFKVTSYFKLHQRLLIKAQKKFARKTFFLRRRIKRFIFSRRAWYALHNMRKVYPSVRKSRRKAVQILLDKRNKNKQIMRKYFGYSCIYTASRHKEKI